MATSLFIGQAFAGPKVGVRASAAFITADGTETEKASGAKTNGSTGANGAVLGIFAEYETPMGITVGLDYVPGQADIGSATRIDKNTIVNPATDVTNKASAEVEGLITAYASYPVGDALYIKAGLSTVSINTTESLGTGTTYGNENVTGYMAGVGADHEMDNGMFLRVEGTYTVFDETTFSGSLDSDNVRNKIAAEVQGLQVGVAIGKEF